MLQKKQKTDANAAGNNSEIWQTNRIEQRKYNYQFLKAMFPFFAEVLSRNTAEYARAHVQAQMNPSVVWTDRHT